MLQIETALKKILDLLQIEIVSEVNLYLQQGDLDFWQAGHHFWQGGLDFWQDGKIMSGAKHATKADSRPGPRTKVQKNFRVDRHFNYFFFYILYRIECQ